MAAPPARAPPPLLPEIVEEILLRFPPDHPAHLVRAALVCKHWSLLIAGADFRRRYRQRHRVAPVLGLIANLVDTGGAARFVPTRCAFRPPRAAADCPGYREHDAHHGRMLLNRMRGPLRQEVKEDSSLTVWDPIFGERWRLPLLIRRRYVHSWNAAVLCTAAAGAGSCDIVDCHFRVVFVGIDAREMFAHVYLSESGAWSEATTADLPRDEEHFEGLDVASPGVLAGDALYFLLDSGTSILRCDSATREISVLPLTNNMRRHDDPPIMLMATEDGGLGFAQVDMNCILRLWSMKIRPGAYGAGDEGLLWVISRAIDLKTTQLITRRLQLPVHDALVLDVSPPCVVVASAEGAGVIFLKMDDGLYSFDLKTGKAVKVDMSSGFYDAVPFLSFYTPVLRVASTNEGPCA